MSKLIQAIRGMNDILPEQTKFWQLLENVLRQVAAQYGYQEIRTPLVEKTELFLRSIGEITDIVEKEMYTFSDRGGESLTLRPEGTAGCVRALIEHGLLHNQTQRIWYLVHAFRYERPQKGRYRQFQQFGIESFGFSGPENDAEVILLSAAIWRNLGIPSADLTLQINYIGNANERAKYREQLVKYFTEHQALLDEDSLRRLTTNPLRILDSKNPALKNLIAQAPQIEKFLNPESIIHFQQVKAFLSAAEVTFIVNPHLVRGLDYYTGVVFEWVTASLGAQGTVCAGGRYDNLVSELGGNITPAIGFGLGCERIIELLQSLTHIQDLTYSLDAYLILVGEQTEKFGLVFAEKIRKELPALRLLMNCGGGNFKAQFKRADKSGARMAFILGDDELAQQKISIKFLREQREQLSLPLSEVINFLRAEI